MIAVMASSWFRICQLLRDDARRYAPASNAIQCTARGIVPKKIRSRPPAISAFLRCLGTR
jgi:hypothetical protein